MVKNTITVPNDGDWDIEVKKIYRFWMCVNAE